MNVFLHLQSNARDKLHVCKSALPLMFDFRIPACWDFQRHKFAPLRSVVNNLVTCGRKAQSTAFNEQ
jgi:hypothetical protein